MIRFICPSCQSKMELPESAAGTRVACPQCGATLSAPAGGDAGTPAGPAPEATRRSGFGTGLVAILVLAVVGGLGAAGYLYYQRLTRHSANLNEPQLRDHAVGQEEEMAQEAMYNNFGGPKLLHFEKWGPHDLSELKERGGVLSYEAGMTFPMSERGHNKNARPAQVIRVAATRPDPFDANKSDTFDMLALIQDGKIATLTVNGYGDDWKKIGMREMPAPPKPDRPGGRRRGGRGGTAGGTAR